MPVTIETSGGHTYEVERNDQGVEIRREARDPAPATNRKLTKFQFRSLLTDAEKIAIDNYESSATMLPADKAKMKTFNRDFDAAEFIDLTHPQTVRGVNGLELMGLIAAGRAARILSGMPPVP